ncbi:SAM-dependent methyltransferase [hydrothermal vent metagenome]|uniref:Arsenite methyltransferase n=1 Tax=hydrothermal vent metagenome TaxID=652676 RepID=A0A3B1DR37_9ZZZZ
MSEEIAVAETNGTLSVEQAVRERYSSAAQLQEAELCCPVNYDPQYLKIIPEDILKRDYGCGDPSQYLHPGDVVLDLGSGGGKICYIASQVVGATGKVIGVDCNDEMLGLAREHQSAIANELGYSNVDFRKGKIQDLQLNHELLDDYLADNVIKTSSDWLHMENHAEKLRKSQPLVEDNSVDVIVSNCVLNLVRTEDRNALFSEMFRVLKKGGRAVISDIVSDEDVPQALQQDPRLWSGCMSGAYREDLFLEAFEDAGFYGVEILERQTDPWAVIEGIEFRSLTVQAYKGKEGPCLDRKQAVVYRGPWKMVVDDDGHTLYRGKRMAVCNKTFNIYTQAPYADEVIPITPENLIPLEQAIAFSCRKNEVRPASAAKGENSKINLLPGADCCSGDDCC